MLPTLFLFLKIALALHDLLWLHMNFRVTFSVFVRNAIGILIGIALHLYTVFLGSIVILTVLTLLVYAQVRSLYPIEGSFMCPHFSLIVGTPNTRV